jgi:hypothetical protein
VPSGLVCEYSIGADKSSSLPGALISAPDSKPFYWPGPHHPRLTPALATLIQEQRELELLMSTISGAANRSDIFAIALKEQLSGPRR